MVVQTIIGQLISLMLMLAVGYALRKREMIDERVTKGLSTLLVNVGMPALVVFNLQQPYSRERLGQLGLMCLAMVAMMLLSMLLCLVACRLRGTGLRETGAWLNCTGFFNAIFMARPLVMAIYGEEASFALSAVALAFNATNFSIGAFLFSLGGKKKASMGRLFLDCLRSLSILACLVGFLLFVLSVRLPSPVVNALGMLREINTPVSMIIIGSLLAGIKLRELFSDARVYLLCIIRLLLAPLLGLFILRGLIADPMILGISVLCTCMPTASSTAVLAERYENNAVLCSKVIFLSTLLCVFTVPLVYSIHLLLG